MSTSLLPNTDDYWSDSASLEADTRVQSLLLEIVQACEMEAAYLYEHARPFHAQHPMVCVKVGTLLPPSLDVEATGTSHALRALLHGHDASEQTAARAGIGENIDDETLSAKTLDVRLYEWLRADALANPEPNPRACSTTVLSHTPYNCGFTLSLYGAPYGHKPSTFIGVLVLFHQHARRTKPKSCAPGRIGERLNNAHTPLEILRLLLHNRALQGRIGQDSPTSPEMAYMLARVSHEVRTPLQSINGFAQFLLDDIDERLSDNARQYLAIIRRNAHHLDRLFDDVLAITRADAMSIHRAQRHLPNVITDAAERMAMHIDARAQKITLDFPDDMPAVRIDEDRIIQVMCNLIGNAVKFAPEGSAIRLTVGIVTKRKGLGADAPDDVPLPCALICVADGGKGLTRDEAENIFLPFFRTEDARRRKIEGTGLGLSVTRSLVEMHGGRIWIVPTPQAAGGCFIVALPIETP